MTVTSPDGHQTVTRRPPDGHQKPVAAREKPQRALRVSKLATGSLDGSRVAAPPADPSSARTSWVMAIGGMLGGAIDPGSGGMGNRTGLNRIGRVPLEHGGKKGACPRARQSFLLDEANTERAGPSHSGSKHFLQFLLD